MDQLRRLAIKWNSLTEPIGDTRNFIARPVNWSAPASSCYSVICFRGSL